MANDLAEGSLFMEFQIASWPPAVTQTLLSKREPGSGLTVKAKPSGRLRVELFREGYESLVVRTPHLRMRTPTLLRLNFSWRGSEAALAANGQIVGTSSDAFPEGVVTAPELEQTRAPMDHVDNERVRAFRRARAEQVKAQSGLAPATRECGRSLAGSGQVLADLTELVREGRHHHLGGVARELVRLIVGGGRAEPLLQWCAGLVDAPLLVYAPIAPQAQSDEPLTAFRSAFDVAPKRDSDHELAVDLDIWLRHEVPWPGGNVISPAGLLSVMAHALSPELPQSATAGPMESICAALARRDGDLLCRFASTICHLSSLLGADERLAAVPAELAA